MNVARRFMLIAALALSACGQTPQTPRVPPAAAHSDPADVIRPIYDRYLNPTDPAVTTYPALEDQAPWSADLRQKLLDMMARSNALNEPILDFDPFTNAQEGPTSNLTVVTEALVEQSHAVVRTHFTNAGREDEVVYDLIWENGAWKIDNIRTSDWQLREIVMQRAGEAPPP
ncbi:MAG: DUF3828 domain-containing protein [Caulobacterales bacterium]